MPETSSSQPRILQAFTALYQLRQNWGGALILNISLDATGTTLALASHIAGAVCLTLEPDPARLREAMRSGACDFVVNTLDEAIRAMKNEIRQHKPLSIGLQGDPPALLTEIFDRGLAPELFAAATSNPEAALQFQSAGALLANFRDDLPEAENSSSTLLRHFLTQLLWRLETFAFTTSSELRNFDMQALALLPPDDAIRRRWLLAAPQILHRDRSRTLWLTPSETEALTALKIVPLRTGELL